MWCFLPLLSPVSSMTTFGLNLIRILSTSRGDDQSSSYLNTAIYHQWNLQKRSQTPLENISLYIDLLQCLTVISSSYQCDFHRPGEVAQSVKCFLHELEDLSSDLQHLHKKQHNAHNSGTVEAETGGPLELANNPS